MAESTFNQDNDLHDLNGANGDNNQIFSELEALTIRINELAADMLQREIRLKDELTLKTEDIVSVTASLENRTKEIAELQNQLDEMKDIDKKNQSLIGELSSLVADQEMQLQNLREVISTKEHIISSFAVSLENSKKEIVELHKQVDELNANDVIQKTLIGEYKEKLDLLNEEVPLLTKQQNESQAEDGSELKAEMDTSEDNSALKAETEANEENSVQKAETSTTEENSELKAESSTTEENLALKTESEAKEESSVLNAEAKTKDDNKTLKTDRKAQKKMLKKLLKQNPKVNEKILAELLGVDSSYIIGLRKELDI